jgi:hypothetical protein
MPFWKMTGPGHRSEDFIVKVLGRLSTDEPHSCWALLTHEIRPHSQIEWTAKGHWALERNF